jgi:predicted RNA-binding protein YlxR (DUF448 family)
VLIGSTTANSRPKNWRWRQATTELEPAETDDTEDDPETGPLRRCVLTRERLPKEQMIRFVIGPDRAVVPDLSARLPGRGIWLSARRDVLEPGRSEADSHRQLVRAFAGAARGPVAVPSNLRSLLEEALVRRITELLGLARRAGQAMAGFEKAREWLKADRARVVLQASDGSVAERTRFLSGVSSALPVLDPLPGAAMGRLFGRDFVVHVAIAPGKLGESLVIEAGRLTGLRIGPIAVAGRATAGLNGEVSASG